jgi:hypothetical protein
MSIIIDGDTFGAAAMIAGRYEVAWLPGHPEYAETETHVPGVDGTYTSSGGFVGQDLVCVLRWISTTRALCWDYVMEDIESWRPQTDKLIVSVTGPGAEVYARCKLKGARMVREIPVGDGSGYHVIDMEVRFRAYARATLPA